jgi:ACS family tartrate transporter-like MFS transporter
MTDRPRDAQWLTVAERNYLENALADEARAKEVKTRGRLWDSLRLPQVWLLALGIFAANTGGYAIAFWLPTTLKSLSGGSDRAALMYSCLFYLCGFAGVIISGQSSDRSGDRKWHCIAGQAATALLLAGSTIPGQTFGVVMIWLCLTGFAAYFWPSPFWALPTLTLTASASAVAIGFINMCANLAGYLGNHATGWMRTQGASNTTVLLFLATTYLLAAIIISFLKMNPPSNLTIPKTITLKNTATS